LVREQFTVEFLKIIRLLSYFMSLGIVKKIIFRKQE